MTHLDLLQFRLLSQIFQLSFYPLTSNPTQSSSATAKDKANRRHERNTHISLPMNSNRVLMLLLASLCSCCTSTGPTCLYTVLFGESFSNSYHTPHQHQSQNPHQESHHQKTTHLSNQLILRLLRVQPLPRINSSSEIRLDLLVLRRECLETILELLWGRRGHG